ncbi:MAG TPA: hypothetical protein VJR89_17525 [Polyangiales bacterium]|nr:hypothetical protein [Polyangiales bacterium]
MARPTVALPIVAACAVLSWGTVARARDPEEPLETELEGEESPAHEHEHHPLALGLDFVLGFGGVYGIVDSAEPGNLLLDPDPIAVNCQSFVVSAGYEIAERIGVGARLPLTFGTVPRLEDGTTHGTFALGNVELEGELEIELSETVALELSLGVALPTAQGAEEGLSEDESDIDHLVLNEIAAASRGYEDNALFEVDRLGIIPKVALHLHAGAALVEPWLKLENLIATNSELERGYVAELVVGTFAGAELNEHYDLGARVWLSTAFLDEVETTLVAEPRLRAHYGQVDLLLGGILPFAGELTDPWFGGVRLGIVGRI